MQNNKTYRLRELDFLRGIAIMLVLFNHIPFFEFTTKIGWIGVDLFFVLSGYLISGLLFKEYIKFGNINPWLFLIRRAFKIYPIYYLFMLPYLGIKFFYFHRFYLLGFIYDSTFVQNYYLGWGYACPPSWSLAIEEHFYFGFAIILWLITNKLNIKVSNKKTAVLIIVILSLVFIIRYYSNYHEVYDATRLYTATHLRIDSLFSGVLISYFYHFKYDSFIRFYNKYKITIITLIILSLSWTPFFLPKESLFARTFGFSLLYISFSLLLTSFLFERKINNILDKFLSKNVVNIISKIGLSSFSIYYIHSFFIFLKEIIFTEYNLMISNYLASTIIFITSIVVGILMTNYVENYFLNIRDKFYPSRSKVI